jgi:hypothetical protein
VGRAFLSVTKVSPQPQGLQTIWQVRMLDVAFPVKSSNWILAHLTEIFQPQMTSFNFPFEHSYGYEITINYHK